MQLKNKTILILSQQDWGRMFISKHHYAVELAKLGNTVYFVNGPDQKQQYKRGQVLVEKTEIENVFLIKHRLYYPYLIKYKFKALHDFLIKAHIKKILDCIDNNVDIIWSFDLSDTIPLSSFPANIYKIYMPVDELSAEMAKQSSRSADIIFSVTQEILSKFNDLGVDTHLIGHGVSDKFFSEKFESSNNDRVDIGLSGNFLRPDIDWETLTKIVSTNKSVMFHFWGAYNAQDANLATDNDVEKASQIINRFREFDNVKFYGAVSSDDLAIRLKEMDGFLICYDIGKDQSNATNYHKILEYLATGGFIVSNNVTAYKDKKNILIMPDERNNSLLPEIFTETLRNIDFVNSPDKKAERVNYARAHTYRSNIYKIETYISK